MRALILADRSFAMREHSMLRRLEIGLIDEGVRLARAVPAGCDIESHAGLALSTTFADRGLRLFGPSPARNIGDAIAACPTFVVADSDTSLDVVHCWGDRAWPLALGVSARTGAALAIETWSAHCLAQVHAVEHRAHGIEALGGTGLWLAPDRQILDALQDQEPRWPIALSDWGVHVPDAKPLRRRASNSFSIAIMASGAVPQATIDCLSGLARALATVEGAMIFLDEAAVATQPAVWKHARSLDLLSSLSIVPAMESRREPVLRTDILVQPELRGEHRTIVLQAMALGACVIAVRDPLVECLDARRAILIDDTSPDTWESAFSSAIAQPDRRARLGKEARSYITANRLGHQHVSATLEAYRTLQEDRPIPFASTQGSDHR